MNTFVQALADICRERMFEEKWLVAPSHRVGNQWLETVTRSGQAAVNVRIRMLKTIAMDLTAPEMTRRGLSLISPLAEEIILYNIWNHLKEKGRGYLSSLEPTSGLFRTLLNTIHSIRLAGLDIKKIRPKYFEVEAKGIELSAIMQEYVEALRIAKQIDYAGMLELAIDRVRKDPAALPEDVIVLLPKDTEHEAVERDLLEGLQTGHLVYLPVDEPALISKGAADDRSDAMLLRWIASSKEAPKPAGDGSGRIFQAAGEVNEVRQVLRLCLSKGLRFDDVEILHTDAITYIPLIYETAERFREDDGALKEGLPITFAEGIPTRYSRPGRALTAWISWIREDYPQSTLVKMIRDGLLDISEVDAKQFSFIQLADLLRPIGIGFGRPRYLEKLDGEIRNLKERVSREFGIQNEDGEIIPGRDSRIRRRLEGTMILRRMIEKLLSLSPEPTAEPIGVLKAARQYIESLVRKLNEFDNLTAGKFLGAIREMISLIDGEDRFLELDIWIRMEALTRGVHLGGSGPRPGHAHVSNVFAGGHSGRRHTFIIGLDDGRFPGAGLQDPLLLDGERKKLSPNLPTASAQLSDRLRTFARLMARLRGSVTMSFASLNVLDDREMFPSQVIISAYRILTGKQDADQTDLLREIPPPVSFAPSEGDQCLDKSEWWLWRMCGTEETGDPGNLLATYYPHMGRGFHAAQQRHGERFTGFDGFVPQAGTDFDPTAPEGPVMSASRLETVGRCPLAYFFKYILEIEPPEELEIDPNRWLSPLDSGSLLHEVFRRFLDELIKKNRPARYERDRKRLIEILDECVGRYQSLIPPPGKAVFLRQYRQLEQTTLIFLREEEDHGNESRPRFLEASIGMPSEGEGTPLDTLEPVIVDLPEGKQIRARGRIDRIDQVLESSEEKYRIWDYKTGSTFRFDQPDLFWQGRVIQHALYLAIAGKRLAEFLSGEAMIDRFGYLFPTARSRGDRRQWKPEQLSEGRTVLGRLCRLLANGSFPATDDSSDCTYCDYTGVCRNLDAVAAAGRMKLDNTDNTDLQPFRELRRDDEE